MSAGPFINGRYQASYDTTRIHPIRFQPEGSTVSPTDPAGAVNNPISARVSGSRRGKGLFARLVTLRLSDGETLAGYDENSVTRLPVRTIADFNGLNVGEAVTYLGASWTVIGKTPEFAR